MFSNYPPFTSPMDLYFTNYLKTMMSQPNFETTSVDGKPLLTPMEFYFLPLLQNHPLQSRDSPFTRTNSTCSDQNLNKQPNSKLGKKDQFVSNPVNAKSNKRSLTSFLSETQPELFSKHYPSSVLSTLSNNIPIKSVQKEFKSEGNRNLYTKNSTGTSEIQKRIVGIWFDPNTRSFVYRMECVYPNQKRVYKDLSKQEVLDEDPMLLIYFYEDKIEFSSQQKFPLKEV